MGNGFLHGNGGANPLNFKVVGGTTEPADPKENMIWVNTDQKITSWLFSATEPTAPEEGMVWIAIGTSSVVEFNALKKNGIQVYPISAKQYVSGAWVGKTAKSYQGGEWVDWIPYLYNNGDNTNMTGGWVANNGSGTWCTPGTLTDSGNELVLSGTTTSSTSGVNVKAHPVKTFDLTDIKTIGCYVTEVIIPERGTAMTSAAIALEITPASNPEWSMNPGTVYKEITTTGYHEIDVSNITGEYYVCLHAYFSMTGAAAGYSISAKVNEVYMKC